MDPPPITAFTALTDIAEDEQVSSWSTIGRCVSAVNRVCVCGSSCAQFLEIFPPFLLTSFPPFLPSRCVSFSHSSLSLTHTHTHTHTHT